MKRYWLVYALAASLLAGGCYKKENKYSQRGEDFAAEKRDDIHLGATRNEVIDTLGAPQANYTEDGGDEHLVYYFEQTHTRTQSIMGRKMSDTERVVYKSLNVHLKDGKVAEMKYEDSFHNMK